MMIKDFPSRRRCLALLLTVTVAASVTNPAKSQDRPSELPPQEVRLVGPKGEVITAPKPSTEVEAYCLNIADKAQDARYALEQAQLTELETAVSKQIDELEAKREDYNAWLAERQRFLDDASKIVVDIYTNMDSVAAAAQLAIVSRSDAASVLVRLKSRLASDILSEMEPSVAAEIATLIVAKTSAGTTQDPQQLAEKSS
ncbi:MotE family protein [Aurantimonas sp. A2-1-M11]|uniref:MotE family protein n=1 Tax=Aurantimonas sp. A2-1-M11 TaxID=3113712 RepID=UPI002F93D6F5